MHEFRPAVWAGARGKKSVQATEPVQVEPDTETVEPEPEPLADETQAGNTFTILDANENPIGIGSTESATFTPYDATDAAKAFAAQKGIDLSKVKGTGVDGRVTKNDVEDHVGTPKSK